VEKAPKFEIIDGTYCRLPHQGIPECDGFATLPPASCSLRIEILTFVVFDVFSDRELKFIDVKMDPIEIKFGDVSRVVGCTGGRHEEIAVVTLEREGVRLYNVHESKCVMSLSGNSKTKCSLPAIQHPKSGDVYAVDGAYGIRSWASTGDKVQSRSTLSQVLHAQGSIVAIHVNREFPGCIVVSSDGSFESVLLSDQFLLESKCARQNYTVLFSSFSSFSNVKKYYHSGKQEPVGTLLRVCKDLSSQEYFVDSHTLLHDVSSVSEEELAGNPLSAYQFGRHCEAPIPLNQNVCEEKSKKKSLPSLLQCTFAGQMLFVSWENGSSSVFGVNLVPSTGDGEVTERFYFPSASLLEGSNLKKTKRKRGTDSSQGQYMTAPISDSMAMCVQKGEMESQYAIKKWDLNFGVSYESQLVEEISESRLAHFSFFNNFACLCFPDAVVLCPTSAANSSSLANAMLYGGERIVDEKSQTISVSVDADQIVATAKQCK
tara:strand:+ start:1429 stop:2892 length:1464 start_codon:yes stop_codon:yes gene_type:complete